jgi:hypothetical protein
MTRFMRGKLYHIWGSVCHRLELRFFITRTQSIERTVLHSELMNVLFSRERRLNQRLPNLFCVTGN